LWRGHGRSARRSRLGRRRRAWQIFGAQIEEVRFAQDSPVEEAGFKLSRSPSGATARALFHFQPCHTEGRNPVEFPLWPYELHDRSKCEGHLMGRTAHHYLIFETAGGFCGITWNGVGITRFQLPTRSAKATERILQRRVPDAEPGAPTPGWRRPSSL
jgi:hypothetical protein